MKDFKDMDESYQWIKRQSRKNLGSPGPVSSHKSHQNSAQGGGRKGSYQKSAGSKVRIQVSKRKVKAYVTIRGSR